MTWGIPTPAFLTLHVVLSLIGIATGLMVVFGMLTRRRLAGWTAAFLLTTTLTSVTGFPLAPFGFDPPRAIGVISLVLLAAAIGALYIFHLSGAWRWIYIGTAVAALYLNMFVAVVQAFQKISFLQALAATQSEYPFLLAQVVVLAALVVLGILAVLRFHPAGASLGSRRA